LAAVAETTKICPDSKQITVKKFQDWIPVSIEKKKSAGPVLPHFKRKKSDDELAGYKFNI
jgi:hypothetical protein